MSDEWSPQRRHNLIPGCPDPIRNPYIVGNPVEDARMFFGRDDDFAYLNAGLSRGEGAMIVLCGTRRSGKTSILFQAARGRLGAGLLTVLIDMQSLTAADDAAFLWSMLEAAHVASGSAGAPAIPSAVETTGTALRALRDGCRDIRAHCQGAEIVFMFDEYELFEDRIAEGVLSVRLLECLADLVRSSDGVHVIFAGSQKLEDRKAPYWSTTLGRSQHRRIGFLSAADAERLITEPLRDSVEYSPGVVARILELGAGQPFYTQVLCQSLVDHLNDGHSRLARLEDVEAVAAAIVDNPLPHMIFSWGELSAVEKVTMAALGGICREAPTMAGAATIAEHLRRERAGVVVRDDALNEALERMFQHDLLAKSPDGAAFGFRLDIWRLWIGRMHPIWQAIDEVRALPPTDQDGLIWVARRRRRRLVAAFTTLAAAYGLAWLVTSATRTGDLASVSLPDSTEVFVTSAPPGADVFIDNVLLGRTPLLGARVEARPARLRLALAGYRDWSDSLQLAAGDTGRVQAMLAERQGSLRVESAPSGATVIVDGRTLEGTTPITIDSLAVRTLHEVSLSIAGHLRGRYVNVAVFEDSAAVLRHDFDRPRHPLTISTDPAGANVLVDGVEVGLSPVSLPGIAEGEHSIALRLANHQGEDRLLTIPAQGDRFAVSLVRKAPSVLRLRASPYADMLVDGSLVAAEAVSHLLATDEGTHDVEFRHPRLGIHRVTVTAASGDTVLVQHRFEGAAP